MLSVLTNNGTRFVLTVQLVEPRSRRVLWSREYEGSHESYLQLVRQAADGIRQAVRPATSLGQATTIASTSESELAFRRGQFYATRYNNLHQPADLELASTSLQRALQLEPTLAEAAAEMAYLQLYRNDAGISAADTMPEAEKWARRALEIDPRTAQAWAALTWVELWQPRADIRKTLTYGLRAAALGPRCPACQTSLSGVVSFSSLLLGRAAEAESGRLDPLFVISKHNEALDLYSLGRADEGLRVIDEALTIEPEFVLGIRLKALLPVDLGRIDEAALLLKRVERAVQEHRMRILDLRSPQYAVAQARSDREQAASALAAILAAIRDSRTPANDLTNLLDIVPILSRQGRIEQAWEVLSGTTNAGAVPPYDWLVINPHLAPLRRDPRLAAVTAKARAQFDEMLQVLDAARSQGELPAYLEAPLAELLTTVGIKR